MGHVTCLKRRLSKRRPGVRAQVCELARSGSPPTLCYPASLLCVLALPLPQPLHCVPRPVFGLFKLFTSIRSD